MGGARVGLAAGLLTALSALSCGDDDVQQAGNQEMADVYRAIGRANCRLWFLCCPEHARRPELFGATEAECVQQQEQVAQFVPSIYGPAITAGRIVFHIEQARACLAALEAGTCSSPDALIDCDFYPIIEPRVPVGQTCAWEYECISASCDRDPSSDADFGKCVNKLPDGAPCGMGVLCASGVCQFDPPTTASRCAPLLANGQSCTGDYQCASGECACEVLSPDQIGCRGATGACGPQPENGCSLD